MIFSRPDGTRFWVDWMSVLLNTAGFLALIASWSDGLLALVVALLIFILDELKHPNPIIVDVLEEDEIDDLDDDDVKPA